jgi:hypothetical protein
MSPRSCRQRLRLFNVIELLGGGRGVDPDSNGARLWLDVSVHLCIPHRYGLRASDLHAWTQGRSWWPYNISCRTCPALSSVASRPLLKPVARLRFAFT